MRKLFIQPLFLAIITVMSTFITAADMIEKHPTDGAMGRIVHGEGLTMAHWVFDEGTVLPAHEHIHEQIAFVVEGRLELTVGTDRRILEAGDAALIPGGVRHEARAVTRCHVIDSFTPKREDLA